MVDQSTALPALSLWCGGYTSPTGTAPGISALGRAPGAAEPASVTAVVAGSPSFMAAHPTLSLIYAVLEVDGTVQAFRRVAETGLEPIGAEWPAGPAACHVFVDPEGRFLVVTCWGDGAVLFYELDADGAIVSRHSAAAATDPYPGADRQSRAHATALLPDGRILTTDLGFDVLRVWRVEPTGSATAGTGLILTQELPLGAGTGPRHLTVHSSGHVYVVTEYSIEAVVIGQDSDGILDVRGRIPATIAGAQSTDSAAEISLNEAGTRVYVTVRGSNRLSTLEVQNEGARLELIGDVDCGGNWPRHHLQLGEWLFVANQLSNEVSVFSLDPSSGLPATPVGSIPVGSPSCLIPRRPQ